MFENKKYEDLDQLIGQNRVLYHFASLCRIPHPSFKEKRIGDFLLNWAEEHGFLAGQDQWNNVWIKKPASPGYEAAPPVMIQAHTDMVCEKAPGVDHDFDTDPILPQLDGDLLSTGGRTTLGADDGIGVACAMAILEAEDLPHPPLEILFTTAEEEDMSGAQHVDASQFQARLLINIDNAVEHELLAGSCGGIGAELKLPAKLCPVPEHWAACRLSVSGLPGGHSGEDIHRGHGNANILLARLLYAFKKAFPVRIGELNGGSFRLAIPRDAQALIYVPQEMKGRVQEITAQYVQIFNKEYEAVAPDLAVTVTEDEKAGSGDRASSPEALGSLIQVLYLSPNGISEMNNALPGMVESSDNLGELRLEKEEGQFTIVYEIRASFESTREYLFQKLQVLSELAGGTCRGFADYPSWSFQPHSRLREAALKVYKKEFNEEMEVKALHAGLECGCLMPKMPGLDAISVGPDAWGLHSPQERLSISSTDRFYCFLKGLLKELK